MLYCMVENLSDTGFWETCLDGEMLESHRFLPVSGGWRWGVWIEMEVEVEVVLLYVAGEKGNCLCGSLEMRVEGRLE